MQRKTSFFQKLKNDKVMRRMLLADVVLFALAVGGLGAALTHIYRAEQEEQRESVVYEGRTYYKKDTMLNVLVLGIDLRGTIENELGRPGGNGQSDMMCVASMDRETGEVTLVTIPRETMAVIDTSKDKRSEDDSMEAQICLQYAYASSSKEGAELATACVEQTLGIEIDHYVAVSMGAISALVDDIGGVEVTMSQDYAIWAHLEDWDTAEPELRFFAAGDTVFMDGAQAYDFVHYRDIEKNSTNLDRMARQKDFVAAFVSGAKKMLKEDLTGALAIAEDLEPYITTDIKPTDYPQFAQLALQADLEGRRILRIPGEEYHVEKYDEYHILEDEWYDMLLSVYYTTE